MARYPGRAARTTKGLAQLLPHGGCRRWQLQDAKAQFSSLVHAAERGEPQCVSRHGKDAVIILSYDAFMEAVKPEESLFEFFRNSPLTGSDIELDRLQGTLREVEL